MSRKSKRKAAKRAASAAISRSADREGRAHSRRGRSFGTVVKHRSVASWANTHSVHLPVGTLRPTPAAYDEAMRYLKTDLLSPEEKYEAIFELFFNEDGKPRAESHYDLSDLRLSRAPVASDVDRIRRQIRMWVMRTVPTPEGSEKVAVPVFVDPGQHMKPVHDYGQHNLRDDFLPGSREKRFIPAPKN